MILTTCKRQWILLLCWFLLIAVSASHPLEAQETPDTSAGRPASDEQYVSIDFNDVDINVFIKFISELTGTNFVVDQRVRGKVTIISPSKISIAEAYKVFESVLEVHGFAAVKAGDVVKIIPAPDARSKNIETKLREESASPEDRIITQIVPLRYADADEIKRLFTPLVSKSSVILSYTPTNMLIVTDVQSNIQRLLKILKQIDVTGMGLEISVIPLDYGDANKVVDLLNTIFKSNRKPAKGESERAVTMVADERTNTIVVLANEVEILRIKQLISMIDKETPRGKGKINVYYLKNASAEDLAKVLQELPGQQAGAPKGKETIPVVSEKVRITADKATNSLIIMADKEDYGVLAEVIQKLDVPRSMVYIEALIMEVNADRSLDLGIDWQIFGETDVAGKNAAVGGGFADGFPSLQSLIKGGLTLGLISEPTDIAGFTLSNISAIINAVKTDDDFRILSTPQVITTDNEEARITIGSNRPFQTRSTTDTSGQSFLSYEYRDVGKILKITPHVTEGRLVRLTMSLEVTDIDRASTLTTGSTLPVTNKRTVDTTVIVKDNHTVVIGGLIEDSSTGNQKKVPVLGDIPVLGWLFRKDSNVETRTNLYIFLTPRVIKHPDEADKVFLEKKGQIDSVRKGEIKLYEKPKPKEPPEETERVNPTGGDPR
jgi:general secretion pathway protein D